MFYPTRNLTGGPMSDATLWARTLIDLLVNPDGLRFAADSLRWFGGIAILVMLACGAPQMLVLRGGAGLVLFGAAAGVVCLAAQSFANVMTPVLLSVGLGFHAVATVGAATALLQREQLALLVLVTVAPPLGLLLPGVPAGEWYPSLLVATDTALMVLAFRTHLPGRSSSDWPLELVVAAVAATALHSNLTELSLAALARPMHDGHPDWGGWEAMRDLGWVLLNVAALAATVAHLAYPVVGGVLILRRRAEAR